MRITIPHLGNVYLAVKILFDSLGLDYVIPPLNSRDALYLGSKYSPEEICLPFKLMVGNYIAGVENGADTVLLVGSCGPCRFGEYPELQIRIMKQLGYNVDFIVMDPVQSIGLNELFKRIRKVGSASKKSALSKIGSVLLAFTAMRLIDEIEASAHAIAGYETSPGEAKKLLSSCKKEVFSCSDPVKAVNILNRYRDRFKTIPADYSKKPLKIAVMGEIYTVIEPFSNLYIEDILMDMRVSTSRRLTPTWWVKDMLLKTIRLNSRELLKASNEFLPLYIGGHARECIGEAVLAAKQQMDGAIQIFPMGCMPEIVSKSILPSITQKKKLPVLSLVVDEMTGEAGYRTRIEAFLDLLERRREHVFIGC
ncbi:MAG TPA: 2-hydroxyglutaryl-CoA dehydratase [Ruminiclostridium sp.]|jgi:predicted nucleotide-binding protein (sugar kinase/HSP70/actin superfamily)|nr:2-hydroxyglutaryl-CoA dehydratase [Clostridiaceae bacterium]HAA25135.1 2-hydroxyglutaryl-CoA dehydratase [Ruminiclostridium sp.]